MFIKGKGDSSNLFNEHESVRSLQNDLLLIERENGFNLQRSGSAPPTVEGAFRAFGCMQNDFNHLSLLENEKEGYSFRSHPDYLAYYYSNENSNPRLPPPLMSRENWRATQRVHQGRGSWLQEDLVNNDSGSSSLFSMQPHIQPTEIKKVSTESLTSLAGVYQSQKSGLDGRRRRSFTDIVQEGVGKSSNSRGHLSRPSSHNSLPRALDTASSPSGSENKKPLEAMHQSLHNSDYGRTKSFSTAGSSSTKIRTSERYQTPRTPPGFPANKRDTLTGKPVSPRLGLSKDQLSRSNIVQSPPLLDMGLSNVNLINTQQHFSMYRDDRYASAQIGFSGENGVVFDNFDRRVNLPRRTSSSVNLAKRSSSDLSVLQDSKIKYQGRHTGGYSLNGQSQRRTELHPINTQSDVLQSAAMLGSFSQGRNINGTSYDTANLQNLEGLYFEALLPEQQRQQSPLNYQYHDACMFLQGNPTTYLSFHPGTMPRVPFQNEHLSHFLVQAKLSSSLLEELKNKSLELVDIRYHFVQCSKDQNGSRFIQEKLETATIEDKMKIFPWVLPHVRCLMTDVFGNYVIQKFFEHSTKSQRKELVEQLRGHVLPLSLQMYGCRVIQKALEVVDLEQQLLMVTEFDGSVLKCVYDQNGNHVIQKCIECIPQDKINFIISSFFGHVATLSTHSYGCRVIQRILEHCKDPNTQQIIMDEIINSASFLAEDQYGNYVIQHVLEHGKPQEKNEIIVELSGRIARMSQQKFASNVVEKCLTYASPEQLKILINEIVGFTDQKLQTMIIDPFGNYVVQRVLKTLQPCDKEYHELIISRIKKFHWSDLKKIPFGKHIVSHIESLNGTGTETQRRSSIAS